MLCCEVRGSLGSEVLQRRSDSCLTKEFEDAHLVRLWSRLCKHQRRLSVSPCDKRVNRQNHKSRMDWISLDRIHVVHVKPVAELVYPACDLRQVG
jgi:hypothetical protein